jgi:hypothetical protein
MHGLSQVAAFAALLLKSASTPMTCRAVDTFRGFHKQMQVFLLYWFANVSGPFIVLCFVSPMIFVIQTVCCVGVDFPQFHKSGKNVYAFSLNVHDALSRRS